MAWRLIGCAVLLAGAAAAAGPAAPARRSRVLLLSPEPMAAGHGLGVPLATLDTRKRLDAELEAGPITLAGAPWRFGLAADAEFKTFFLALTGRRGLRFYPVARPRELIAGGQDFHLAPGAAFHLAVKPRWSDPLHASQIEAAPLPGTPGPAARWPAAKLLDMVERQAAYFRQDGQDYFLAFVSAVDPATRRRAAARSLVIFAQRRFRSRLWRLPIADLRPGAPARVRLGRRSVVLLLRPDGLLVVYSGG